jgi:hypothetical protein
VAKPLRSRQVAETPPQAAAGPLAAYIDPSRVAWLWATMAFCGRGSTSGKASRTFSAELNGSRSSPSAVASRLPANWAYFVAIASSSELSANLSPSRR